MTIIRNELGQPVGAPLKQLEPVGAPSPSPMNGRFCRLERLASDKHGAALHREYAAAADAGDWTYLPYGPFAQVRDYLAWIETVEQQIDPLFFAICDSASGTAVGVASYLRIDRQAASIEVGHIHLSRRLQKTGAASEAMYLMMARAFESGYRRYEWKCDDLNAASRSAAARLGFHYEGTFRQATRYKGRNRDTAWFSILDREWLDLRTEFVRWLDEENFDADGRQCTPLRCPQPRS